MIFFSPTHLLRQFFRFENILNKFRFVWASAGIDTILHKCLTLQGRRSVPETRVFLLLNWETNAGLSEDVTGTNWESSKSSRRSPQSFGGEINKKWTRSTVCLRGADGGLEHLLRGLFEEWWKVVSCRCFYIGRRWNWPPVFLGGRKCRGAECPLPDLWHEDVPPPPCVDFMVKVLDVPTWGGTWGAFSLPSPSFLRSTHPLFFGRSPQPTSSFLAAVSSLPRHTIPSRRILQHQLHLALYQMPFPNWFFNCNARDNFISTRIFRFLYFIFLEIYVVKCNFIRLVQVIPLVGR